MLDSILVPSKVEIHYIRQKQPLWLGHAIWSARKFIGNEPFAVLLGDDIVGNEEPCLMQMIKQYDKTEKSIISVQQLKSDGTDHYDSINPLMVTDKLISVKQFVEKPAPGTSPSNYAIIGRYIL